MSQIPIRTVSPELEIASYLMTILMSKGNAFSIGKMKIQPDLRPVIGTSQNEYTRCSGFRVLSLSNQVPLSCAAS
ncbi:hypothetical protein V6x_48400 [Gimesia chilikensis]|uniref:Uncharacterized protein n=1 Tax=Gimesia chilikensis TaxID=2605989 RepID=A0A517WIM5_9PLAN|nr:hypothetical protein V6x_48400 [Gimesia chilikensis]